MIVYVETNFVLELAFLQEEHESCATILSLAEVKDIHLVLPAFSVGEAYEAWVRRSKRRGPRRNWADLGGTVQMVRTPLDQHPFVVQSWRRIVERTLAWVGRPRRCSWAGEHDAGTTDPVLEGEGAGLRTWRRTRVKPAFSSSPDSNEL